MMVVVQWNYEMIGGVNVNVNVKVMRGMEWSGVGCPRSISVGYFVGWWVGGLTVIGRVGGWV